MFVLHAFTVFTVSQAALMTHPGVMATDPFSPAQIKLVYRYKVFYEEMGMYLFVLVLWLPYIAWCILGGRDGGRNLPGIVRS
jgi:hypothetical protein